jgi:F-type H+-transporting ATPase subunit delta
MAELTTIARPYAEAAFRLAREANALPAWSEMLRFASAVNADPRVAAALDNPKLTGGDRHRSCCRRATASIRSHQFRPRAGRGRSCRAAAVNQALFEALKNDIDGVAKAGSTAFPLTDAQSYLPRR